MIQLAFWDIDEDFRSYMLDADYGDLTPTVFECEGVIWDS